MLQVRILVVKQRGFSTSFKSQLVSSIPIKVSQVDNWRVYDCYLMLSSDKDNESRIYALMIRYYNDFFHQTCQEDWLTVDMANTIKAINFFF
jgi:hypothetical protein